MKIFISVFTLLLISTLSSQQIPVDADTTANIKSPPENSLQQAGQQTVEKTLLETPVHHGIYGAPVLKSARIGPDGVNSLLAGAQIGWILNKKYVIAFSVNGLASRVKAPPLPRVEGLILIVNYGGLYLSYLRNSNSLIHFEAGSLVGIGQAFYRDEEYKARYNQIDAFIMIEPEIRIMLNVMPGFRMGAGLSYRYTRRVDLLGLSDKNLSGVGANLIFKIGRF